MAGSPGSAQGKKKGVASGHACPPDAGCL